MTETLVDFRHNKRAGQHTFKLDKGTKEAMADYWRLRWPTNTAKYGAREFGLTLDQARSVVAGRASLTTLDQIEKAGGWAVIFAVKALVVGYGADQFLIGMRNAHVQHGKQFAALFGDHSLERAADPGWSSGRPVLAGNEPHNARRRVGEG